jgi:hypothetical protein
MVTHGFASGRSRAAQRFGPLVLKSALWTLVLAWASWIALPWLRDAFATPAAVAVAAPRPALDLEAAIATAAATPTFGAAAAIESAAPASAPQLDIKLKGVFASGSGPMGAIVDIGGEEDQFVVPGRPVGAGAVLEGVYPTHIVVSRGGVPGRIELEALKSDASKSKAARSSGMRPVHGQPPVPSTTAGDAPATSTEAESSAPLAPPMPQSQAVPNALSRIG